MHTIMNAQAAKDRLSNFKDKPWRMYQEECIEWVADSDKRIKILVAPTGSGKTIIGMTCGVMAGDCTYLCSTKILQQQIACDFPESRILWGKANYGCLLDDKNNCDQCSSTKTNPCPLVGKCLYKVAKDAALEASLRTLNYSYFISETQFAGRFKGGPFCVIDECDVLEQTLIGSVQLQFTERALYRLGLADGPSRKTVTAQDGLSSWREFGMAAQHKSKELYEHLSRKIESFDQIVDEEHFQVMRERDFFKHINERCDTFLANVDKDWVLETQERQGSRQGKLIFRPLWLTPELSNTFLFDHADEILMMSATLLPKPIFCKTLGLDPDEVDWKTIPSTFPIENRPIHVWPCADVTNKNIEAAVPDLVKGIEKIFAIHPHEKGLIQGVSYSLCKKIYDLMDSPRLKIHTSIDRQDVLDEFVLNEDNSCLISPSMERGVSLEGSKCDFVICIKAPYLSLADRTTSQRLYGSQIGKVWYRASMMLSLVQSCGRGMRSADDHCVCYLIDSQIEKVYLNNPLLWPDWFRQAISWDDNLLLE